MQLNFLSGFFVASPVTDSEGFAIVKLPDYFETLNSDFTYQLTVMGVFAQAIVHDKISNNEFVIRSSVPGVEVSWQVTGVRKDPYANENRIVTEVEKEEYNKGYYLHPKAYGKSDEQGIPSQDIRRANEISKIRDNQNK